MAATPPGGGDAPHDVRQDARRLFLGNLPKVKTDEDIRVEVGRMTRGLVRVITYKDPGDPGLHRGFCFLDYQSADAAAAALRRLSWSPVFGCRVIADWADPEPETDADAMARVRILFVRQYGGVLEEAALAAAFGRHGAVNRVKGLKHYAFVHFARREDARAAMEALDGTTDAGTGVRMEVSWAKPPADKTERERTLRGRERRMLRVAAAAAAAAAPPFGPRVRAAAGRVYTGADYDHYAYDFGAGASASAAHEAAAACDAGRQRPRPQRARRSDVDGRSCGDDDVDHKIRMFFFRLTVGAIPGRGVAPAGR